MMMTKEDVAHPGKVDDDQGGGDDDDGEGEEEAESEDSVEESEEESEEEEDSDSEESVNDDSSGESDDDESEDEGSDGGAPTAESEGCPYVGYEENECGRREWCEAQCVLAGGTWEGPYETDRQTMKVSCTTWDENDEETLCDYRKTDYMGGDMGCD